MIMGTPSAPPAAAGVTSNGLFEKDDPLKHSLLLLIVQIVVILCFSRLIAFFLRPLRQPRVVAEIIGGILLGPSAFGNIRGFSNAIFPESSLNILQTVANFGLIFFLFLVGLELDLGVLRKTGSRAMGVAAIGIVVPFALGVPVSLEIFEAAGMKRSGEHFGLPFILFLGVALSITAFPVLARILTERKIMNTELGQIAISAAAVNDVAAWALLALAVAVSNPGSSPLVILWVIIAAAVYLAIMFIIVRPFVHALAKRDPVREITIAIIFLLVLTSSFVTDVIGINVIFGAFIMGLIIPKDQPISGILIEKTEDFASILLLPLYFTSSGLKVELASISNGQAVSGFLLVTATAVLGKVLGTMVVAKSFGMSFRNSAALGFLMTCKGLVELIVLNIGLSKGVINKEIFAIMVLMALVTTIATTPMTIYLYKDAGDLRPSKPRNLEMQSADKGKLRMLVCLYGMRNTRSMMSLIEMSKGSHSKIYEVNALHLREFSERFTGAVKMAEVLNAAEPWNDATNLQVDGPLTEDAVAASMKTFGQLNHIHINVSTSMSRVNSMHEDICSVATKSRANIIILPYHKYFCPDGTLQSAGAGFSHIYHQVLEKSPCSVAILVDRGLGVSRAATPVMQLHHHQVLVLFFGGSDDREALLLAKRMAEEDYVKLTVVQCILEDRQLPAPLGNLTKFSPGNKGPEKSFQKYKDSFMRWGGRYLCWVINHDKNEEAIEKSATLSVLSTDSTVLSHDNSSPLQSNSTSITPMDQPTQLKGNGTQCQLDGDKDEDDIKVSVEYLEQENEKKLDARLLSRLQAAAANQPRRIIVKTVETGGLEELLGAEEYGLILVGLHASLPAEIRSQSQHNVDFQSGGPDHGVGPIGNWLISKELKISLLVVWQHGHSLNEPVERTEHDIHSTIVVDNEEPPVLSAISEDEPIQ